MMVRWLVRSIAHLGGDDAYRASVEWVTEETDFGVKPILMTIRRALLW